jgi:hypothetical protein
MLFKYAAGGSTKVVIDFCMTTLLTQTLFQLTQSKLKLVLRFN